MASRSRTFHGETPGYWAVRVRSRSRGVSAGASGWVWLRPARSPPFTGATSCGAALSVSDVPGSAEREQGVGYSSARTDQKAPSYAGAPDADDDARWYAFGSAPLTVTRVRARAGPSRRPTLSHGSRGWRATRAWPPLHRASAQMRTSLATNASPRLEPRIRMAGGPSCPGFQCSVIWSVRSFFRVRSAVMLTARGGGSPAFDVSFTGFAARGQAGGLPGAVPGPPLE